MTWPSFSAYIEDRVVFGPTLVCPVRIIFWDYQEYCKEWGFDAASPGDFVEYLEFTEGVSFRNTNGPGKFKRCALGIGLLPTGQITDLGA